jgi:hypothetical protein
MKKTGEEKFSDSGRDLGLTLLDFWQWYASDLLTNSLRGVLAEFIVARALGINQSSRLEWDAYDLKDISGLKVEVKSAAYLQTWSQKRPSRIIFSIAPTQGWDAQTNGYSSKPLRQADVYVFCLYACQDKESANPLSLEQWRFFVLPASSLNKKMPRQKTLTLGSLEKLNPQRVDFNGLAAAIRQHAPSGFSPKES